MDVRYKNIVIENGFRHFPNQGTRGTARLWTLRSKFNTILEMVSDSDIHLSKLDAVLKRFVAETSNNENFRIVNDQSSQFETNIRSSGTLVLYQPRGGLKVHPGLSLVLKILYHRRK